MPVLWKLQLHVKQKASPLSKILDNSAHSTNQQQIVLTCLFALGFFVTVIQIIRIFSIANLKEYSDSKNLILWSIVEVSLGVRIDITQNHDSETDEKDNRCMHPNLRASI